LIQAPSSATAAQRQAAMTALIYRWTGVDNRNPTERSGSLDSRKIDALEIMLGRDFTQEKTQVKEAHYNTSHTLSMAWEDAVARQYKNMFSAANDTIWRRSV
jgi:hypothetical protein